MLDQPAIAEQLSLAYVRAVVSSCGFSVEPRSIDRDGIDLSVHGKGLLVPDATVRSPVLDVQAKASTRVLHEADQVGFDLPVKNHRLLVERYLVPRVLLVLELPAEVSEWLHWSEAELSLRRTAWWVSLEGAPSSANDHTQRIWIPKRQVFSPAAVTSLMHRVARQESLAHAAEEPTHA